jgi:hypothetical protein
MLIAVISSLTRGPSRLGVKSIGGLAIGLSQIVELRPFRASS